MHRQVIHMYKLQYKAVCMYDLNKHFNHNTHDVHHNDHKITINGNNKTHFSTCKCSQNMYILLTWSIKIKLALINYIYKKATP